MALSSVTDAIRSSSQRITQTRLTFPDIDSLYNLCAIILGMRGIPLTQFKQARDIKFAQIGEFRQNYKKFIDDLENGPVLILKFDEPMALLLPPDQGYAYLKSKLNPHGFVTLAEQEEAHEIQEQAAIMDDPVLEEAAREEAAVRNFVDLAHDHQVKKWDKPEILPSEAAKEVIEESFHMENEENEEAPTLYCQVSELKPTSSCQEVAAHRLQIATKVRAFDPVNLCDAHYQALAQNQAQLEAFEDLGVPV